MADDTDDVVYSIVDAVADRERVAPSELPPLQSVVDCDALTALFDDSEDAIGEPPTRLEITYCDYEVTVERDGDVTVVPMRENRPV